MEPLRAFIVDFWWIAPASVGAGGVGYAVITKNSRRARRLELDAARHEEAVAYRASLTARAEVRAAHANVQTAHVHQRQGATGVIDVVEARRRLSAAKRAQKDAAQLLRAARTRVRAVQSSLRATARGDDLPLAKLMHRHDEITARWLAYETDAEKALTYPQMTDAQHPATLAFLRAHSEAHRLRPASPTASVRPDAFVAYRHAVETAEHALDHAEAEARRAAGPTPFDRARQAWASASARANAGDTTPGAASRPIWPVPRRGGAPPERPGSDG